MTVSMNSSFLNLPANKLSERNAVWVSLLPGLGRVQHSEGPQLLTHDFMVKASRLSYQVSAYTPNKVGATAACSPQNLQTDGSICCSCCLHLPCLGELALWLSEQLLQDEYDFIKTFYDLHQIKFWWLSTNGVTIMSDAEDTPWLGTC
jgi:hypothetical protein